MLWVVSTGDNAYPMRKIKNYLELLITQKSMEADKEIWKDVDG
jgi:hypothetical protein